MIVGRHVGCLSQNKCQRTNDRLFKSLVTYTRLGKDRLNGILTRRTEHNIRVVLMRKHSAERALKKLASDKSKLLIGIYLKLI